MEATFLSRLISAIFGKASLVYTEAQESIDRVYAKVNYVGMEFPDVHSFDFQVVKNEWNQLPEAVSHGVSTMGLHIEDDYRSLLVHYTADAYITPHVHSKEWEIIKVLEGECYDLISNTTIAKGDTYIVPKGHRHHIVSKTEECYMYILFTEDSKHLIIPHEEPDIAVRMIKNKCIKKAQKI